VRVLAIGNRYPPESLGGYEAIWHSAMAALRREGRAVRVLTSDTGAGRAPFAEEDPDVHRELRWYWREHDFPKLGLVERLRLERHNARVLRRHLGELAPDVVFWWSMGGMSLSLIEQVRRAGVPAIGLVGDEWLDYGTKFDWWTRMWRERPSVARLADRLSGIPTVLEPGAAAQWHFISAWLRERTLALGWSLPDTRITHPGVPARFTAAPEHEWSGRLLYVGRIEERKGVDTAVEALGRLPDARLTLDGAFEGGYEATLLSLADGTGVRERLTIQRSARDALPTFYAAADAVVFPVRWPEPWGLVPLEAMAVGTPVVATGTGGSAEYLRDRANCLLVAPDDPAALAAAVQRLAADEELRRRLRAGGLETASRYTEDAFNEALCRAVAEVAAQNSPSC
jgi:glycogen synthase